MWGGYTGAGHKTIVPAQASAKVSFRLVAGQEPLDVQAKVRSWLEGVVPDGIEWDLHWYGDGVSACLTPLDHPNTVAFSQRVRWLSWTPLGLAVVPDV